jgi:hypothetical protein
MNHRPAARLLRGFLALSLGLTLLAVNVAVRPAAAVVIPHSQSTLLAKRLSPLGFVATSAPQELQQVAAELGAAATDAVAAFQAEAGPAWRFYVDRRSGGMALVEGQGLRWFAPEAAAASVSVVDLEKNARGLIERYPSFFQVPNSQLALDSRGSVHFGEQGQFWNLVFRQEIGGIPVDNARVVFRVSHGNLVQFGVDRTVPQTQRLAAATPALTRAQAKAALAAYLGGLLPGDRFVEDGTLLWVPRGAADQVGFQGAIGSGWKPELVYRFAFLRAGEPESWQALVDAVTGEVVRFVDTNEYAAALARGSVYTVSNCTDPTSCTPGSQTESAITMPNAQLTFTGGSCAGSACYTNSAGAFLYPPGATAATITLTGKYFKVVDQCGAVAAAGTAPGNIDLGTSDPLPAGNTDCAPATRQSAPQSGALSDGSGDTHSARNTYYHLNLMNQKARFYMPNNDWLKGVDGSQSTVLVNTDIPPMCNAFWQGTTDSLNFQKVTPGLFCNNTGEVPTVFLHEFGHGLDQNDATGTAPEGGTGEAMGDTFALLEGQQTCIGPGFRLSDPTAPNWGNKAGYGSATAGAQSRLCAGVRDLDYTRLCSRGADTTSDCIAPRDPDAPNGSHSGLAPDLTLPDAGTPARWNTLLPATAAPPGVADGKANFYNCALSNPTDPTNCAGPLGYECHCESEIASQANFDLVKRLIATDFGGNVYTSPQGPHEVSGWQYMDRLWYLTRDLTVSAYSVTGIEPSGTTNGCGVNNWFESYRFIDDNDGNLANGTPHAAEIFAAFDLHAIACGTAADAANQSSGCPATIAAPTLSACSSNTPVQLSWTPSAGATQYRVLRNTLGCQFGFQPLSVTGGAQQYFEDPGVAPGVPYYYSVQPVGANSACYGVASNCIAVTPTTCSASALPAPTGVTLSTPANNQIQVSWNPVPGAAAYKVYRKGGDCSSGIGYVAIATIQAPTTTFLDTSGLQGTFSYSYQVVASDSPCAACTSPPSACAAIVATGSCFQPPSFAGAAGVASATGGSCELTVNWQPGSAVCGSGLTYAVYRSTSPGFLPDATNRIASNLATTAYSDFAVTAGTKYFYIVRATDLVGNTESNLVRRYETPAGALTPGTFSDDAGDTGTARLTPSPTPNNGWTVRPTDAPNNNTTKHYATNTHGVTDYPNSACMGLESPTLFLGASPSLSFDTRYSLETGFDAGVVEVATEAGGFANWTKLTTITYPGAMAPGSGPACGGAEFAAGQMVFTGVSPNDMWANFSGSLSAYANQHVRIRFLFTSDNGNTPNTYTGWFVDNIQVTGTLLPGPCTHTLQGFVFHTTTPCRVLDTRVNGQGPALSSGTAQAVALAGACGIPVQARTVSVNVTVTQPTGDGHLQFYPDQGPPPGTSTINFRAGETRANNAILLLDSAGLGTVQVLPLVVGSGTVHLIVDVNGWFEYQ